MFYVKVPLGRVPSECPHDLSELDASDGSATVSVEKGKDLSIFLNLVLGKHDGDLVHIVSFDHPVQVLIYLCPDGV